MSAVIPNPTGSDPAAPSANAASTVPARPRPTCSQAGVSAVTSITAQMPAAIAVPAPAPAMPVRAMTGAAALMQKRPARDDRYRRMSKRDSHSNDGSESAGNRKPDRDLLGQRTRRDLAQP